MHEAASKLNIMEVVINIASPCIASEHARACAVEVQSCDYTEIVHFVGHGRGCRCWTVK
jgi:N-dimethylarginine dimethylaminohydrolase